jgi:F-type H+-transporting ATPase subunit epsilon
MKKINLKITTPERVVMEKEVTQVTLPTRAGEITILPDHVPLLSTIASGILEAKDDGDVFPMAISGGFLEFHDNQVTILADMAERAEELDVEKIEEAKKRAEELKSEARKTLDEGQYASVVSQLEKQLARIKVAKKYRPRGGNPILKE